jgi:lipopolysaccharide export system protein LptA
MKLRPACLRTSLTLAAILLHAGLAAAQTAGTPAPATPAAGAPAPINITATQGIEWRQADQEIIATGNATAVRGAVTVSADQLIAHYRKKATPPGQTAPAAPPPAAPADIATANDPESALNNGDTEIYQLDAVGHVHIYTTTDNAYGDHAVYSMDNAVLVLTGTKLKLTTPTDTITARDAIEYYSVKRMAVARGDALIVTNDGKSIAADILIGYLAPAAPPPANAPPVAPGTPPDMLGQSGKLQKVEAIGHVVIRSPSEMASGNRGVYLPEQGLARLGGDVHIVRGANQLNGADALVNTKTGVATLLAGAGSQVSGIIVPNSGAPQ